MTDVQAKELTITVFMCNWCAAGAADLAGDSRLEYPANVRIVPVPCAGRINPLYIVKALQAGSDGILVAGCHPGDCHFISGNRVQSRKFAVIKKFLGYLGLDPARVQFSWVTASEGVRFAGLIRKITDDVSRLGSQKELVK